MTTNSSKINNGLTITQWVAIVGLIVTVISNANTTSNQITENKTKISGMEKTDDKIERKVDKIYDLVLEIREDSKVQRARNREYRRNRQSWQNTSTP